MTHSENALARLTPPRVLILLDARPVLDVEGFEVTDDEPRVGEVIAVRLRLPNGVTDRYLEVGERHGEYLDVNGDPVDNVDIVSWRYPSADELADWNDAKNSACPTCSGRGAYTATPDSGTYVVEPCDPEHPRAKRCDHKVDLGAWR